MMINKFNISSKKKKKHHGHLNTNYAKEEKHVCKNLSRQVFQR